MARSTRAQNAEAGPSQSQRRTNGFGSTQHSTQDDEVLHKPALSDEEEEDHDPRQEWTIDTFENQPVDREKYIHLVSYHRVISADRQLRSLDGQLDDLIQNIDVAVAEAKDTAIAVEEICPDDAVRLLAGYSDATDGRRDPGRSAEEPDNDGQAAAEEGGDRSVLAATECAERAGAVPLPFSADRSTPPTCSENSSRPSTLEGWRSTMRGQNGQDVSFALRLS